VENIFEIGMLVCFGFAWPVNIYKSLKSKSVSGKSVFFLYIVLAGYASGITHKFVFDYNYVVYLYIINALMVSTDIILYYRNKFLYSNNK
jgi:hypothetical protein